MSSFLSSLGFGKSLKEKGEEWQKDIAVGIRGIERDINALIKEEEKIKKEIKKCSASGDAVSMKINARSLMQIRKGIQRLNVAKATLNGVSTQIRIQLSTASAVKSFKLSASIMKAVNKLSSLPETMVVMQKFQTQLENSTVIENVTDDIFLSMSESLDSEEKVDDIINEVLGIPSPTTTLNIYSTSSSTAVDLPPPSSTTTIPSISTEQTDFEKRLAALES